MEDPQLDPDGKHEEQHRSNRIGWLRAAVLGANDGIVSTASLVVGVASAEVSRSNVLLAGVAGLVAGAFAMAAGEYVSVSSQADTERADLEREKRELEKHPERELAELAAIYRSRGLDRELARQVAIQLTQHDALAAHARDEIGISEVIIARPVQAALASACSFAIGAVLPLAAVWFSPDGWIVSGVATITVLLLASLGAIASLIGGSKIVVGTLRVLLWGVLALVATAVVGRLFGVTNL